MLQQDIEKLLLSILLGAVLGMEREYKSKAAGLRTIALICVGATLFTIMSQRIAYFQNADRIASNIVTGIGFIGAGVIFKNSVAVSGLTTAATIWIAAAIGMTIGGGQYLLAIIALVISLVILGLLEYIQDYVDKWHQKRLYRISFHSMHFSLHELESIFKANGISYKKKKESRDNTSITCIYEVYGRESVLDKLNEQLIGQEAVDSFDF